MDINIKINTLGLIIAVIVALSDHISFTDNRLTVTAQRSSRWQDGSLRLVGGRSRNEGTVLVYHWSRWGAICDDYWDIKDANVVCNELEYPGAKSAPRKSKFGKGRRRVWLSGLHCRGNERHITMCYSRGWGTSLRRCRSYWSSAGVVCNDKPRSTTTTTTPRPTRKRTTTTTTPTTTTTTTTPKSTKTTTAAPTTTTTTTTPKPTTTTTDKPTTTTTTTTTQKPTTSTSVTPKPTTTTTTEKITTKSTTTKKPTTIPKRKTTSKRTRRSTRTSTTTTPVQSRTTTTPPQAYDQWIYNSEMWRYYMYFRDGTSITSRPDPRYFEMQRRKTTTPPTTTTTTTTTTPRPPPVMDNNINSAYNVITGNDANTGNSGHEGVSNNQIPNNIDQMAPQTVIGSGSNNQVQRHPTSRRQRTRLHHHEKKQGLQGDQPHGGAPIDYTEDVHADEPESKPAAYPTGAPNTEFRLVGGRNVSAYMEGRLEVRLAGESEWGVICADKWDLRAAIVTCRHLGVGYARIAQTTDYYGGSDMDKKLATVTCTGREDRLEDCVMERTERTPGHEVCSKAKSVAGVICDTRLPDLTPDIKVLQESAFLHDQYLYYLQCSYEEGCLSSSATEIYGTRMWTQATRRLLRFSTVARNIGNADFRPHIDRSQWEWHACHQHYHSMESFSHYDIIDKHGNKVAEGLKASFCLEDSQCDRGVRPKFNCQHWGQQGTTLITDPTSPVSPGTVTCKDLLHVAGISVGCRDSYLADIDCQWIDVTDVKPGMYTLKVELNPDMNVPETSFDNNVAVCSLYFNTAQARIYNCKLGSLL